jgi:hypothetical protein
LAKAASSISFMENGIGSPAASRSLMISAQPCLIQPPTLRSQTMHRKPPDAKAAAERAFGKL